MQTTGKYCENCVWAKNKQNEVFMALVDAAGGDCVRGG